MAEVVETEAFAKWLKGLRDPLGRRGILRRLARLVTTDNFGDRAGVGDGVSELRIDAGPGYRVYYTIRAGRLVLLLCGGDKDSQERDIKRAKEMAAQLDEGGLPHEGMKKGTGQMEKTRPFDAANYIDTAADQAALLSDAIDSGDRRYIAYALGAVARARGGIAKLAREAGMNRQALHRALSEDGNPTLDTVLKVLKALGLHMRIEEAGEEAA